MDCRPYRRIYCLSQTIGSGNGLYLTAKVRIRVNSRNQYCEVEVFYVTPCNLNSFRPPDQRRAALDTNTGTTR